MEGRTLIVAECSECQGAGWVVQDREGTEEAAPCPACRHQTRLNRLLSQAQIPPRYAERGFRAYSIHHPLQERALKRAIEYVEAYPRISRGLLLTGPCGVGKTHLSVAILKTLIEERLLSGTFVDEAELLRRLQYSYSPGSPETERDVLKPLLEIELLVWDDLGTGRPTEWVAETIRTIINHRYTYRKHTIFTTNLALQVPAGSRLDRTLAERIGVPLFSRIMEMCEVLELNGPDFRTEIQKAGYDFGEDTRKRSASAPTPPDGAITCPFCESSKITRLDQSKPKRSGAGTFVRYSCLCEKCSEHFVAQFFPDTGRVEYPPIPD